MHQVSEVQKNEATQSAPAIVESATFQQLMRQKNGFILPAISFCLIFYFALPILTSYFTILNEPVFGDITGAWVFAFAQFIMTWTFCMMYSKKARAFDRLVEQIKEESK